MKIIILSDFFGDQGSDIAIVKAMAFGFKDRGHEVGIITTVQNPALAGQNNIDGINIYSVYTNYNLFWRPYVSLYNLQTVKAVGDILNKLKPDVVHAHVIHIYLSYKVLEIAKKAGAKVFLTAHDVMLFHYGKFTEFINENNLKCPDDFGYKVTIWQQIKKSGKTYNPFRNITIRHYLKYVDKIFAVSNALKQALEANGITNIDVAYNGIDVSQWQVDYNAVNRFKDQLNLQNKKIIFFGSRLSNIRGQELIINLVNKVLNQVPSAVLLIAGNINKSTQSLLDLAGKFNIRASVISCGWLSGVSLKAALHASDVIISPSPYFDTFLMLNLEAMACQKPVVSTCFGGPKEVVLDGQTGYIVNPFDIEELTKKIVDLLKNPEKARAFGEAGFNRAKNDFNADKMIDKILACYSKY